MWCGPGNRMMPGDLPDELAESIAPDPIISLLYNDTSEVQTLELLLKPYV